MKLKKIASLMLAGIMAVSMLAGCKSGSTGENGEQENPVVPTTSNLADMANGMLTGAQEDVFSFHNNATLNTALEAVATDKSKVTAAIISGAYDAPTIAFTTNTALAQNVIDKFTAGTYTTTWAGWANAVPSNAEKKDAYVEVGVLTGLMTEEAVAKAVVDYWDAYMTTTTFPESVGNNDFAFSADISAVKVTNCSDTSKTAWVVAVMINKTVTDSSNAKV